MGIWNGALPRADASSLGEDMAALDHATANPRYRIWLYSVASGSVVIIQQVPPQQRAGLQHRHSGGDRWCHLHGQLCRLCNPPLMYPLMDRLIRILIYYGLQRLYLEISA